MSLRNILALYITVLLLPLMLSVLVYVSSIDFNYYEINDEIALNQLRDNLLFVYELNVNDDELNFIYKGKRCHLSMINNKLIMQPGTLIYLADVDNLFFSIKDNCVFVNYERRNKKYERVISFAQGLYLDEFSNCDVTSDESDSV